MLNFLRISVHFLMPEPSFHGKRDGGEPEWPPSPLRLFQAIVDAAADQWRGLHFDDCAKPALELLQGLVPEIVAPSHVAGTPFRTAVPNNDLDVWARPLSKGNEPKKQPNELKTMKTIQPIRIRFGEGKDRDALSYLYPLPPEGCPHLDVLRAAARSVTHLGWGVDMVAADAAVISQADADGLPGHRWRVVASGGVPLRVPKAGTLDDLMRKHTDFLHRLSADGFRPVPPLQCFDVVRYHSPTTGGSAPPARPLAAFEIHRTLDDQEAQPGRSRFRPFHHVRHAATVAGMVRHAAATAARALGRPESWVNAHVLGHGSAQDRQAKSDDRLMFLPLPSIQPVVGVGGIRRVLVVGWPGGDGFAHLRQRLNGAELVNQDTNQPEAVLAQLASTDRALRPFLEPSRAWCTATPVILPGYDDPDGLRAKLRARAARDQASAEQQRRLLDRLRTHTLALIWKAFRQAGWTEDMLRDTEVEYRSVGWLRGLSLARDYDLPPLKFPRCHVRVRFARPVAGPLVLGAGRYRGMGVFVREH